MFSWLWIKRLLWSAQFGATHVIHSRSMRWPLQKKMCSTQAKWQVDSGGDEANKGGWRCKWKTNASTALCTNLHCAHNILHVHASCVEVNFLLCICKIAEEKHTERNKRERQRIANKPELTGLYWMRHWNSIDQQSIRYDNQSLCAISIAWKL